MLIMQCFLLGLSGVTGSEDVLALIQALRHGPEDRPARFVSETEITEYPSVALDDPPEADAPTRDENWVRRDRVHLLVDGDRVRLELSRRERMNDQSYERVHVWDGQRLAIMFPGEQAIVLDDRLLPVDLHGAILLFNRVGPQVPDSFERMINLQTEQWQVEEATRDEDVARIFVRAGVRDDYIGVTWSMRADVSDEPRLLSFDQALPLTGAARTSNIKRWRVENWMSVSDGFLLPERAVLHIEHSEDLGDPDTPWRRRPIEYQRTAFDIPAEDDVDPSLFEIPIKPGTRIVDRALRISYQIGRDYLQYDEMLYSLPEPIEKPIEPDELPQLLENAKPIGERPPDPRLRGGVSSPSQDERSDSRALFNGIGIGALVFSVVLVVWFAIRRMDSSVA